MLLHDLLPVDIPQACIATFEYDTRWLGDPAMVSLRGCRARLLQSILWDRTHAGDAKMCRTMVPSPIPWHGHSSGGLRTRRLFQMSQCLPSTHLLQPPAVLLLRDQDGQILVLNDT